VLRRSMILLAGVALVLSACSSAATNAPASAAPATAAPATAAPATAAPATAAPVTPKPMRTITALMPNPSAVNVYNLCAAIGEGYMAEEGLNINFEAVDGSSAVYQAMVAGRAEIGLPGPGPTIAAWGRGEKPVLFYNHFAQSLFGLVVAEASDITTVAQLKGKIIGVGTAEGSEVSYARAILSDAGLKEDTDYKFLAVGDGGMAVAAFERKDIAAYSAAIPDMAIMTARGLPLREITPEKFLAFFGNGYATLQTTIDSDPELIASFTRAIMKGTWFAEQNKDKTLADCAKLNPEEGADTALASALFDAVLPRTHPLGGLPLGEFTPEGWKAWQDSLISSGELAGPLSYLNDMWTNKFVQQAHKDLGK
jgi:NitT/TauT family transport system substrate-binding protein